LAKFVRTLQKIGNSILVSLPKQWVDTNNLHKSDEVELEANNNNISITINKNTHVSQEVIISYPLQTEENIIADIIGAYLSGYDLIKIKSKDIIIPTEDREKIRGSMRRLVGMEIVEEGSYNIDLQFLLDSTTLNPEKILKRISTIELGMFNTVLLGFSLSDRTNLHSLSTRDDEVDRQYFLLVRLIRTIIVDRKLANKFNLENIDILDYRIAAHILETTGDVIVDLANLLINTTLSKQELQKVYDLTRSFGLIEQKSIDAFILNNRCLAIEAIKLYNKYQKKIYDVRYLLENTKQIPLDYLDIIHMLEKIIHSWIDLADLVKPNYNT